MAKLVEEWGEFALDFEIVDVELLEEGLVEIAADPVRDVGVELLHVGNQLERVAEYAGTDRQLFGCVGKSCFNPRPVNSYFVEFRSDFGSGQCAVGREVNKP